MERYFANDLNHVFTNKVNEYIRKGYTINTGTMAGHQGEISKIHLLSPDNRELVNILMTRNSDIKFNSERSTVEIVEKVYDIKEHNIDVNSLYSWGVVWNDKGKVINKEVYYAVLRYNRDKVFIKDEEEFQRIYNKQNDRQNDRLNQTKESRFKDLTSNHSKHIVLPYLRRQPKCKSIKIQDINRITKEINGNKVTYCVFAKGTWFELN